MSFLLTCIFRGLWGAVICAQTGLLILLIARKAYKEYPAFVAFVSLCVARSFVLLYVRYQHPALYGLVKWLAYVPQLAILIAVVLEVFHLLFHPFEALPGKAVAHFIEATGAVGVFAVGFAICHPGAQPSAWMTFATAMDQVVSWVLCAIFILVALFSTYFGIHWRHRVYGIGFGFLLYLSTDVAVTTAVSQFRLSPVNRLWLLDMLAFLLACVIWTYYFWRPEARRSLASVEQIEEIRALLRVFSRFRDDRKDRQSADDDSISTNHG